MKFSWHLIALITIFSVAFLVRIYHIGIIPAGFFCDEASIGFDAYTILHTGKDQFGTAFPLFFRSLDDYKAPIAIYSTVPFVSLFGLNEVPVRLVSAVYGMITLLMLYLIAREFFSKQYSLIVTCIGATMPWLIHYDRVAFLVNIYATFFITTIYLFMRAAKQKQFLIPAFTVAALTFYTYQPAKLLVPLLLIGICFIYRKTLFKYKKQFWIGAIMFSIISLPMILSFFGEAGTARFHKVSLFAKISSTQEKMDTSVSHYFHQLSTQFFLQHEATPIKRHFVDGLHPLLPITYPFIVIGVILLFFKRKEPHYQLLGYWLFLYPIAGAVVAEGPFTNRAIIGAPLFVSLATLGIHSALMFFKRFLHHKIILAILLLLLLSNFISFTTYYFSHYPKISSDYWGWQYGPKEIFSYYIQKRTSYDEMYLLKAFNAPDSFIKFYTQNHCPQCRLGAPHEVYNPKRRQLFAITPGYLKEHPEFHFTLKKTIYYPNTTVAFFIVEATRK